MMTVQGKRRYGEMITVAFCSPAGSVTPLQLPRIAATLLREFVKQYILKQGFWTVPGAYLGAALGDGAVSSSCAGVGRAQPPLPYRARGGG